MHKNNEFYLLISFLFIIKNLHLKCKFQKNVEGQNNKEIKFRNWYLKCPWNKNCITFYKKKTKDNPFPEFVIKLSF